MKSEGAIKPTEKPAESKARKAYEAPRILTHSAEVLKGATLAVNACTGLSRRRGDDDSTSY